MKRTSTSLIVRLVCAWAALAAIHSESWAQEYTEITTGGNQPGQKHYSNDYGLWNYPIEETYISGAEASGVDYYDKVYIEWVLKAEDLRAAGLCPGPLTGLGMRYARVPQAVNARVRIFLKHIGDQTGVMGYGRPVLMSDPTQGMAGEPIDGAVKVYDNGAWTLNTVPQGDSAWVDMAFNQDEFIWDGVSNIMVNVYRCPLTQANNNQWIVSEMLWTEQEPPERGDGWWDYQWPAAIGSKDMWDGTCDSWQWYNYNLPFLQSNFYQEGRYDRVGIRPVTRLRGSAGLTQSFPDDVDPRRILRAGGVYDGSEALRQHPSMTFYQQAGEQYTYRYRITGPKPSTNVVYESRSGSNAYVTYNGTENGFVTIPIPAAAGALAGTSGALDLTNAAGGAYNVSIDFGSNCGQVTWVKEFLVSFPDDIATVAVRSPESLPKRSPLNVSLPLSAQIQNVGYNTITDASIRGIVRRLGSPTIIYDHTEHWTGQLLAGERSVVDFFSAMFTPTAVGLYTVEFCATLNSAIDNQTGNNCLPANGEVYTFQVNYNEEPGAGAIISPEASNNTYYVNRPIRPEAEVVNSGILDLSDVPTRMRIYKYPDLTTPIYTDQVIVQSVDAAAPNNVTSPIYRLFTPTSAGQYRACMTVEYGEADPEKGNNISCVDFTVNENLAGTYTIGTLNQGKPRNYPTIETAVNDLYLKGIDGAITFELTDESYVLNGSNSTGGYALDLTGYITGVNEQSTITFKPSTQRSLSRGSVKIILNSQNGVGIRMGQALNPTNIQAVARQFPFTRMYSNSNGYFTFDGGSQKSIQFDLNATTPHRAVFFLGEGSHHNAIRNCILGNGTASTASYALDLPKVFYTIGTFNYDDDVRNTAQGPVTYSAGIVNRAKRPLGQSGNNSELLDTVINASNKFVGNEISGFGYGVVSLGMGTLIKGGVNEFRSYYNTGTEITSNLIYNVSGGGVMVGYEDGVKIGSNRIYNVGKTTGATVKMAAGIAVGTNDVYNTMDAWVGNNEISGVRADSVGRGIVVEQGRNAYQSISQAGGFYYAPSRAEHSVVVSNAVWGLQRGSTNGSLAGIHLQTRRLNNDVITPWFNDYFTRQDSILNNTVAIGNDNISGAGAVVGIGVQHANTPVVLNNAIALELNANAALTAQSALLYQGTLWRDTRLNTWYLPGTAPGALVSDRNAFYVPNSGIGRYVEVSQSSELVSIGSQTEYATIEQWRSVTKQDNNSVVGNFMSQHEYTGIAPNQHLRVKVTPQAPLGSILNNRGLRLASVKTDIDGALRGEAGLGYDIGADEFNGRMYVSDLEVIDITRPSAYRSQTGATSDAEHVMTKAPIEVGARIRNNGSLTITNSMVRVRVFMETSASNNSNAAAPAWNTVPVVDRQVSLTLASGESKDISFNVPNWTPLVYFGLTGYAIPARFATMAANVTPRYRIEVTSGSDENVANNIASKTVRFYLAKSQMSLVMSVVGSTNTITTGNPTPNQIAGRLNSDSLMKSFSDLGFYNDPANNTYAYDVFERSAWEPLAVDYTIYRTLLWSHNQEALSRPERDDIRNFVAAGNEVSKKNLVIGSQELARRHTGTGIANDVNFVNRILRAQNVAPGTPYSPSYNDRRITGSANVRGSQERLIRTGFNNDGDPVPALITIFSDAATPGLANASYIYNRADRATNDSIMGSSTASLRVNTIYLGADWRHYQRAGAKTGGERVLRGIIDFIESHGGTILPVEMVDFDARVRGANVDVFWATASELNSGHFVVERARVEETGTSDYRRVAMLPAAGNSTVRRDYAITDQDVASGVYLYRLTSIDKDGSSSQTGEVQVVVAGDGTQLSINGVTPNPASHEASLSITLADGGVATIAVVDVSGREVLTLSTETLPAGTPQTITLPVANLASGAYTVVVRSNGMMSSQALSIVR